VGIILDGQLFLVRAIRANKGFGAGELVIGVFRRNLVYVRLFC